MFGFITGALWNVLVWSFAITQIQETDSYLILIPAILVTDIPKAVHNKIFAKIGYIK